MSYSISVSFTNEEFKMVLDDVDGNLEKIPRRCKESYLKEVLKNEDEKNN